MTKGEAGEGGTRRRVGVGRPFAGEVRQEDESLRGRGPARSLRGQNLEAVRRAERVAQPTERAGGGEHHAHRMPSARNGMAEGVDAPLCVGRERR